MKNITKFIAVLSVATLAIGAIAQGPPQGGGGGGLGGGGQRGGGMQMRRMGGAMGPSMMVLQKGVQEELKLTSEQKDKLDAVQQKMRDGMRAQFQGGGERPSPEQMQALMKKGQEEMTKSVNEILTPEQRTRLQQVYIQTEGVRSVTDAGVAKAVGITAAQKTKIDSYVKQHGEANRELFMNRELAQDDRTQRVENNNKALTSAIEKVLTAEQKKKLTELEGPKYTPVED